MNAPDRLTKIARRTYKRLMVRAVPVQSGVLPWRLKGRKKAEVLLVTGRRSGRWMIPKGWPMPGKTLADSAAREAFEEAGIEGLVDPQPIGTFRHVKQNFLGDVEVDILVHPLAVRRELSDWPEKTERSRKWFAIDDAAQRVSSEELGELIVRFAKALKGRKKRAVQDRL